MVRNDKILLDEHEGVCGGVAQLLELELNDSQEAADSGTFCAFEDATMTRPVPIAVGDADWLVFDGLLFVQPLLLEAFALCVFGKSEFAVWEEVSVDGRVLPEAPSFRDVVGRV